MIITFPYTLVHDTKIQAMKVRRDRSFRCKCEMRTRQRRFQVFCSNASPYPGQTRSVDTIAASTTCCPRITSALCSTRHYTLLLLLYHVSYERNRIYEKGASLRPAAAAAAAQQHHDAPIWPSCCTTTEMQPHSDTVPPTSFSIHVDMVLVPCVLHACVLCAIVTRCAG